jgi:hypothetical protein
MTNAPTNEETTAVATAAGAYARRGRRCRMMADWVAGELDAHAERAAAAPGDWGFAGDLGEAERLLADLLARLIGTSAADVTATVDEAVPGSSG